MEHILYGWSSCRGYFPHVVPGQTRWAGKECEKSHGRNRKAVAIIKRKKAKSKA